MQSDLVGDIYFMTGIYAIINPNNEYYIGKSTNIKRRFGYYHSKERVEKVANSNRGKKRSEETKALMSKRHMEKGVSKNVKPPKIVIAEHKVSGEKIEKSTYTYLLN